MSKLLVRLLSFALATGFAVSVAANVGISETLDKGSNAKAEQKLIAAIDGLGSGKVREFDELFDIDQLLDRVFAGVEVRDATQRGYRTVFKARKGDVVNNLAYALGGTEAFTLMRVAPDDGFIKALYRMDFGDDGLNFIEFYYDSGSASVVDWYDYALGQEMSAGVRTSALLLLGGQSMEGFVRGLFDGSSDHRATIQRMAERIGERQFAQAVAVYRDADSDFQRLDAAIDLLSVAGSHLELSDDYDYALSQLARYRGDDPRFSFLLFDHYFVLEDFDRAVAAIDSLQKTMGLVEAGLQEVKAAAYVTQGNGDAAINELEIGLRAEPDRDASLSWLFELYVDAGRYADAGAAFEQLNQQFGYGLTLDDLAEDEDLLPFVQWYRQQRGD